MLCLQQQQKRDRTLYADVSEANYHPRLLTQLLKLHHVNVVETRPLATTIVTVFAGFVHWCKT